MAETSPQAYAFMRRFQRDVERETAEARAAFLTHPEHLDNGMPRPEVWLNVTLEELGKLSRCVNKLNLAQDATIREQWSKEGYRRIVTTASLLRRLAERWDELVGLAV